MSVVKIWLCVPPPGSVQMIETVAPGMASPLSFLTVTRPVTVTELVLLAESAMLVERKQLLVQPTEFTMIVTVALPVAPWLSVTVSVAVYVPEF